jgi:hypothetical protein
MPLIQVGPGVADDEIGQIGWTDHLDPIVGHDRPPQFSAVTWMGLAPATFHRTSCSEVRSVPVMTTVCIPVASQVKVMGVVGRAGLGALVLIAARKWMTGIVEPRSRSVVKVASAKWARVILGMLPSRFAGARYRIESLSPGILTNF